jgi:hypothetical protein
MIPRTARKIRSQMGRFSGKVSEGMCKAARRFVGEMLYGIQARQSVHLTEVGRSLGEGIALIKTENRLSRDLSRPELRPALTRDLPWAKEFCPFRVKKSRAIHPETIYKLGMRLVVTAHGTPEQGREKSQGGRGTGPSKRGSRLVLS